MPDCTELQNAVDASLAIIDAILANLDAELIVLQDRITALDECMMGEFLTVRGEQLQGLILHAECQASTLNTIRIELLSDDAEQPAIDEGGAGPVP